MMLTARYAKGKLESLLKEVHIEADCLERNIDENAHEYIVGSAKRLNGVCLELIEAAYAAHLGEA